MSSSGHVDSRAAVTTGDGHLQVESVPVPKPDRGEALIATRLSGVCGTDLVKLDQRRTTPGTVLGHELVADVLEVGDGCPLKVGQRTVAVHHVACGECRLCRADAETQCPTFRENLLEPGAFSEVVLLRARACTEAVWPLPEHVTDEAAIFLEPAACVLRSVTKGLPSDLQRPTVIVLGAGSMGQLHGLVLKIARPDAGVLVLEPRPERRQQARRAGLEVAPPEDLESKLEQLGSPDGVDAVFDTAGGHQALMTALSAVRPGGRCVLFAHSKSPEPFDLDLVFKSEKAVVGSYSGGRAEQQTIFRWLSEGDLDPAPLTTHIVPLDEVDKALELCRRAGALKVAFEFQARRSA